MRRPPLEPTGYEELAATAGRGNRRPRPPADDETVREGIPQLDSSQAALQGGGPVPIDWRASAMHL